MRIAASRDDWMMASLNIQKQKFSYSDVTMSLKEIKDTFKSKKIFKSKYDFIDSFDDLVVVKLKSEKSICPIDVVKVILPNTLQYEQSEMFTGIPRAS